jgi:transglutaminase-like putative cysteine protease
LLTIRGSGFGRERGESYVLIGGDVPTLSSYTRWSDGEIVLRLPQFGETGLLYVWKDGQKSNPMIFLSGEGIPRPVRQIQTSRPLVERIVPLQAFAGQVIGISGTAFGDARGAVRFVAEDETVVEPPELAGEYRLWKDREIRLRVPDGARDGFVVVRTAAGSSNKTPFMARYRGGSKRTGDTRAYAITHSVDVEVDKAGGGAVLYVWMPVPARLPAQNPRAISRSVEPYMENQYGLNLYVFADVRRNYKKKLTQEWFVEVSTLETKIDAAAINPSPPSAREKMYLKASPLVPSADAAVIRAAEKIIGAEKNPYVKAFLVYRALTSQWSIGLDGGGGALEALQSKTAGAESASLLFCALCRAAGVAAAPVAGVLVDRNGDTQAHYWAQFWLEDFGWVPVDAAFGAGAVPSGWTARPDCLDYYFGSMDNRRIAFSEGEPRAPRIRADSRARPAERFYSLQNTLEEAAPALEAYQTVWSGITVSGVY